MKIKTSNSKRWFEIREGDKVLAEIEAVDKFVALREFRNLFRNTWAKVDSSKVTVSTIPAVMKGK